MSEAEDNLTAPPVPAAGPGDVPDGSVPDAGDVFVLPASFTQQRLWFLDRSSPHGGRAYNVFAALRIRGPLDAAALEASLQIIVDRHESLRTTFTETDGEPMQVVAPALTIALDRIDATAAGLTTDAALIAHLEAEAGRPFDLTRGPLLRAQLIRVAANEAVLMLVVHHIVVDGWSIGVLMNELAIAYGAAVSVPPVEPMLPELPVQFGDYAVWQQEWVKDPAVADGLAFWTRHLGGELTTLELPRNRPRPATARFRGQTIPFSLPAATLRAVNDFSRGEGASLFMTMLSAFALVVSRYSGSEDVLVGSPIANRLRSEVEPAIGFFANTVVFRADLSGAPTFRALVGRVRKMALEVYAHQEVPFEHVVRAVRPERAAGVNPLFQVVFAAQKMPDALLTLPGLDVEPIFVDNGTAKFDLLIDLQERSDRIDGVLEFNGDLFDREAMEQLLAHYHALVSAVLAEPDRPVTEIAFLSAAERTTLLRDWNDTAVDWNAAAAANHGEGRGEARGGAGGAHVCVHDLIAEQASRQPDALAVVGTQDTLTYRQLDEQASRLAAHLTARGVGPGALVALHLQRTPRLLVAMLGVLKAGGAYLPLDPDHPSARRDFMLRDARVSLLLSDTPLAVEGVSTLRIDQPIPPIPQMPPIPGDAGVAMTTRATVGPSDPAYIIYTSGSTGQPKGVVVAHGGVVNLLRSLRALTGLSARDVMPALSTITFDASVLDLLLPLSAGARIVLARATDATDGRVLAELLERHGVTFMFTTPPSWRLLLEAGWRGRAGFRMMTGGEPLARDLADALLARGAELWNLYGPTETTVCSTASRVAHDQPILIGRPIANTRCYVLDAARQLVPAGVTGELYIGGAGVALGYQGRPDLTADRFLTDPFVDEAGARMYRTGDLVRHRPTGELEYVGRADHQVKLRGFRIELGEIESVLLAHPSVSSVAVLLREDRAGDPRLVAYVAPSGAQAQPHAQAGAQAGTGAAALNLDALRAHLKDRLPYYMVPSAIVALDTLPLTSSGKVDRRALPAPTLDASAASTAEAVAPRNDVERTLAAIWSELLGVDAPSVHADFFDLGGHSLLAMRLVSRIEAAFGTQLPLGVLLEAGTIARLAQQIAPEPGAAPRRGETLILFRGSGGERAPLFLCHAAGGEVLVYTPIVGIIGVDRPVYGLQADGWTPEELETITIEKMAERYVQEVRSVQPHGPYHLGGFCAGATIALEMAQQLKAAGEEVAIVAVLDQSPRAPRTDTPLLQRAVLFTRNLPLWMSDDLFRVSSAELRGRVRSHLRVAWARLARRVSKDSAPPDVRDELGMWRFAAHLAPLMEALYRAVVSYRPRPYEGRVVLFRARCGPLLGPWPAEEDYGWSEITRQPIAVETFAGSHSTFIQTPFVARVGARVRACLLEVEAGARTDRTNGSPASMLSAASQPPATSPS